MSTQGKPKVSLKLFVDKNANRIIFAEAGKEFVDFLFYILTLPLGAVVKFLSPDKMVGSIGKIYQSIEAMDTNYMDPNINKQHVLNPKLASIASMPDHSPSQLLANQSHYVLNDITLYYCGTAGHRCVTNDPKAKCPADGCGSSLNKTLHILNNDNFLKKFVEVVNGLGYVKGLVTYMVMDNLMVKPMSTTTLLSTFKENDLDALETIEVSIGTEQAVEMLKASLQTDKVLTSMFLVKQEA